MLGLNYGSVQLVLPNWRIEGADEPFAIRLFPGWNTYVTYPFYALTGISSTVIFFLIAFLAQKFSLPQTIIALPTWSVILILTALWAIFLSYTYRKALFDIHERPLLLLACNLASLIRLKLVRNFEYIIYRATLSRYELSRMKIELFNFKKILVFIEDHRFHKHHGVSLHALIRAFLGLLKLKRRSGGSTITQQLSRTLFIKDLSKLVRRKLIELVLALWLDRTFSKEEQLEIYLASVRFERGVYGVLEAMKYYWNKVKHTPTMAESFFLVERVSNVNSQLLTARIIQIMKDAVSKGILNAAEIPELLKLYSDAVSDGKIKDSSNGISRMKAALRNL